MCYADHAALQDASRLVFVSVKDAKPKRKVAVAIGDGSSWEQFCSQVGEAVPTRNCRWLQRLWPPLLFGIRAGRSCQASTT